jgi:hypothetical protein
MPDRIRVFVNGTAVDLPPEAAVADAVDAFDPSLKQGLVSGTAFVTDGRGIEIDPAVRLSWGDILRVASRARRSTDADA